MRMWLSKDERKGRTENEVTIEPRISRVIPKKIQQEGANGRNDYAVNGLPIERADQYGRESSGEPQVRALEAIMFIVKPTAEAETKKLQEADTFPYEVLGHVLCHICGENSRTRKKTRYSGRRCQNGAPKRKLHTPRLAEVFGYVFAKLWSDV